MAIPTPAGFAIAGTEPIDNRIIFASLEDALDGLALVSSNVYVGLLVFISNEQELYFVSDIGDVTSNTLPTLTKYGEGNGIISSSVQIASDISGSFNGQTGSFVVNSQTASFVTNSETASFVLNSQTASFVVNSQTASFVTNSQTGSFVVNSQTSSFVVNSQTSSFVVNSQTGSFVVNSQTASFVVNSQTGSFVVNSQTSSFVTNSQTGSFVVNSQTGSFVVNSQTGSFVVNSQTGSFVVNSQTASFVTNSQTSSFVTNSETASFVVNSQTSSFLTSIPAGTYSHSLQTLGNITSSGDISASGTVFANSFTTNGIDFITVATEIVTGSTRFGTVASASDPEVGFITSDLSHEFTGSVSITGSFVVQDVEIITSSAQLALDISGSFNGQTGSFVTNSQTSSFVTNSQTSSFVTNSQTSSFVTNSQTSSFVINSQTGSFVVNSQTGSFVTNSQTASFVVNSQTGSFVTNSQTSSFVTNSQTSSFVTNSQTASFVVNSQTGSFVTNSQTSSFVTNSQTSSFVTNSQTSSFVVNSETASFVTNSQTSSFLTSIPTGTYSSSLQTLGNITSSGNISASGTLFASASIPTHNDNIFVVVYDTGSGEFHYTGSYGGTSPTTNITEFSFDSIVVSDVNTPFSSSFSPSDDGSSPQLQIQTDNGSQWQHTATFMHDSTVSASLIDGDVNTISEFNVATNNSFNLIWDFSTPKVVSEFRHDFNVSSQDANVLAIPLNIFIYGKTTPFDLASNGVEDGVLLGEGARPGQGGMGLPGGGPLIWSGPSYNPLGVYGIGTSNNLKRTSSIVETSLTSSFRYYRVRYNDVNRNNKESGINRVSIKEITPVTRSFEESGTSILASNGVFNATQIVCNNIIGTSSFATLANSSVSSSYALTASFVDGLVGTFTDSTLHNPTLLDNVRITGSLVITASGEDDEPALANGNLRVHGNLHVGSISDVENVLSTVANFNNIGTSLIPNDDSYEEIEGILEPTLNLGSSTNKWNNLFAKNTFFGGVHEINLETEGLDQMQEGTVLVLSKGHIHPCEKEADPLVMGIVSKNQNYPIVLGAEPVLVTGIVKEGDFIITSNIKGHGKGVSPQYIYSQQLFGKIIAQAIEDGEGESYTIKAMIRKM